MKIGIKKNVQKQQNDEEEMRKEEAAAVEVGKEEKTPTGKEVCINVILYTGWLVSKSLRYDREPVCSLQLTIDVGQSRMLIIQNVGSRIYRSDQRRK